MKVFLKKTVKKYLGKIANLFLSQINLLGANNFGFNTIYVKNGIGEQILPAVTVDSILMHPRNKERQKLFEPIREWEYVRV